MIRIDVLDASGNKVGSGPLVTVEQVTRRRSLDKIGGVEFPIAAVEPKTAVIGAGRKYAVYHREMGYLGTFSHARQQTQIKGPAATLVVSADDELVELVHKNCYFRRNFNYVDVASVVSTLVGLVAGWSVGAVESGIGHTTVSYEGESVFEALDVLRDRWGRHFRLSAGRTLDFGAFGEDSGLRLIRADSAPRELAGNRQVALVTSLEIVTEADAVINRLIPVGAGVGTTQLTLQYVTEAADDYPVKTGTNADGSAFYYIEDTASQAAYGLVERPFERSDIRPLSNSGPDLANAANALYWAALAGVLKWRQPRTTYQVQVTKLAADELLPGQLVRLFYRGVATAEGRPYKWVDVDADLWVMDIEETYGADGTQQVSLTVATTDTRRTADSDVLAQLMRDAKVFKTHVQPNLTHSPVGPYVKRLGSGNAVTFNIRLKDEVLAVNRVVLRFITSPLRSSVAGAAAGGGTTQTSSSGGGGTQTSQSGGGSTQTSSSGGGGSQTSSDGGGGTTPGTSGAHLHDLPGGGQTGYVGSEHTHLLEDHSHSVSIPSHTHQVSIPSHTHQVTIPNHTHQVTVPNHTHAMQYGIYQDNQYPQTISVAINGQNRTAVLGGPWAGSNAAVDVEVEVTEYIARGQDNTVTFSCTAGRGELTFLADCLLTIQAIVVT